MLDGVIIGIFAALLAVGSIGRTSATARAQVRPSCSVSILLLEADRIAMSKAIDTASGGLGCSHAAWDACESVDGVDVGIDCRPGKGVHRRPLADIVGARRHVRVFLPLLEGREAYGCARARVGEAYDGLALFLTSGGGRRRGTICSELVYECLPARLQARIPLPSDRPGSPNDIARAFGIANPSSPDVHLTEV